MWTVAASLAATALLLAGCAHFGASSHLAPIPKLEVLNGIVRNTTAGQVEGRLVPKAGVLSWEGVRYAKPPVGDLRWQAPQPLESWTGVVEAKNPGEICPQEGVGCEDCLFLNIYRPNTPEKNLPVYVWIHGGSNKTGKATNLAFFAKEANVVAVSIQYRLGPFGFFKHDALNTGDPLSDSGNYGLLDQMEALKWVRANITSFGGNPHNVTAAGESAGAGDIYALLTVQQTKGLFHKAIAQSPGARNITLDEARKYSAGFVTKLGLTSKGQQLAKDLRAVQTHDLLQAEPPRVSYSTILDGKFIKDSAFCLFEKGDYHKMPVILGGNRNEYSLWLLLSGGPKRKWGRLWRITSGKTKVDDILNAGEKKSYALTNDMGGKIWQACKVHRAARSMRKHQKDVYVYTFQWGGAKGSDVEFVFGAAHANEIAYFNYNGFFDIWAKNRSITQETKPAREALAKAMRTYYAQFLHSGKPNGKADIPIWEAWSNADGGVKALNMDASSEPGSSKIDVFMTRKEYTLEDLQQEIAAMTDSTAKKYSLKIVDVFTKGWIKDVPCGD